MTKQDVPVIARMIIISDILSDDDRRKKHFDNSYYNADLDRECEYCRNTSAWD